MLQISKMAMDILRKGGGDAHKLMTALRGPDCAYDDIDLHNRALVLKAQFTTPIRCFMYGLQPERLREHGMSPGDAAPDTSSKWSALRVNASSASVGCRLADPFGHYLDHVRSALYVIINVYFKKEGQELGDSPWT